MHLVSKDIIEGYISSTKCVSNSYTLYEIVVITNIINIKNYKIIYKRYSDFSKLHKKISKHIKELPVFPDKKIKKLDEKVVKERVMRFNFYVKYICMLIVKKELNDYCKKIILDFLSY